MKTSLNRRNFLKMSAVGGAAATLAGCQSDPVEKLIPLLVPPVDYVPGKSVHYATTCMECSAACGLVIRTREGRAIKAEGNPHHPVSKGRICAQGQSILQGLYSPSRASGPVYVVDGIRKAIRWEDGISLIVSKLKPLKNKQGKRILYLGPPKSGTFPSLLSSWMKQAGGGTTLELDLMSVNSVSEANRLCFGSAEIPHYALDKAEFLLNFGSDFLESWLNPVQLTADFSEMHSLNNGRKGEFVHVGPHVTLTGSNADEWISCAPGSETYIALAVCRELLEHPPNISRSKIKPIRTYLDSLPIDKSLDKTGISKPKINELAKKFNRKGKSLALAGGNCVAGAQATDLQIAVNLLNYLAGNIGETVLFGADYKSGGSSLEQIDGAIQKMKAGRFDLVIIENVNPVFTLPKQSGFEKALKKAPFVVSLSTENDETSTLADLHLPTSHFLESWGDAKPRNGLFTIQQAVMDNVPQFDTMGLGDLFLSLGNQMEFRGFEAADFQQYLKNAWSEIQKTVKNRQPFARFWNESLRKGCTYRNFTPRSLPLRSGVFSRKPVPPETGTDSITLLAVNSNLHNSNAKGGNKTWLLETPHPLTQVVWDSWLEVNPQTAERLSIKHGELVELETSQSKVKLGVWVYHGIEDNTVAIPAGLGRSVLFPTYKSSRGRSKFIPILESGDDVKVRPRKVGINAMELLPWKWDFLSGDLCFQGEIKSIRSLGKAADLVTMDGQHRLDINTDQSIIDRGLADRSQKGRGFIQTVSLGKTQGHDIDHASKGHHLKKRFYTVPRENKHSFYDPMEENVKTHAAMSDQITTPVYHDPYKWEIAIDLDRCIGCSACVIACYAENNIPMVGKNRAALGREMSWLRISRYFEKNPETGKLETYYSPQMCQQCDNAGCEPVCPVYATYQTPDGLNAMIYNRCVGTRYCSNNCAFAQRRFNWRSYQFPSPLHLQLNPAVSVRSKGVMEKCTFCQHRIREMKDIARDQGRTIRDGEIQTACQQACPANAIVFGNIKDKNSQIYRIKQKNKRKYTQLAELNYQPAVSYLKKVNLNNRKA